MSARPRRPAWWAALADWFAWTALFKHRWHTDPAHRHHQEKKDQQARAWARSWGELPVAGGRETKLRDAQAPSRLGKWLSEPLHAHGWRPRRPTVLRVLVELLRDEDVQHVIDRMIVRRIAGTAVGSAVAGCCDPAGREPAGNPDPAAGRPRIRVVAERR